MREAHIDLEKREFELITAMLDNATSNVTAVFNSTCEKILQRRKIEGFKPPFEVVIGCGGLATRLSYWALEPGEF